MSPKSDAATLITLTVNGKQRELSGSMTIGDFLQILAIESQFVAVGHNGIVVEKKEFGSVLLNQGDTLEIVRPVGGG